MSNRIEKELKRFLSSQEYKKAKCDSQKSIAEHFYAFALKDVVDIMLIRKKNAEKIRDHFSESFPNEIQFYSGIATEYENLTMLVNDLMKWNPYARTTG